MNKTVLKVAHVVPSIASESSGPTQSVQELCEGLASLSCDVSLLVTSSVPSKQRSYEVKSFARNGPFANKFGRSCQLRDHLGRCGEFYDFVHNHSLWMMSNIYGGWFVNRGRGYKFIVSPRGTLSDWAFTHGSKLKKLIWYSLQYRALSNAYGFHATSGDEADDIRKRGFSQPIAIISNGISIPQFKDAVKREKTILYLGRLHPKKGLDILIKAWASISSAKPEWRLLIAGPSNDNYRTYLEKLVCEGKVPRVEFLGQLVGDSKWQAYRTASLFVLPTHSENFGMTVAEALASGTPAVVSRGAPWSGLNQTRSGWWIDLDQNVLADTLKHGMSLSEGELSAMGERGRAWMESQYSWSEKASQMFSFYLWMLGRGDKPSFVS